MFQQPSAGGDKIPFADLVGSLALFWVREHRPSIITAFGEKDAVACDVHILDGPQAGTVYENSLIFQGALIGSLKPAAGGDPVLARIGQGTAKPGQNPPYILMPFTAADAAAATAYIQRMPKPFQAPANGQTPPPAPVVNAAPPQAMTAEAFAALPLEVQELLRQSGQVPAGI
jgi:hypothetical protein